MRILAVAENKSVEKTVEDCQGLRYGDLKVRVGEAVVEMLRPFQDEYKRLVNEKDYLLKCAKLGKEKAQAKAEKVLKRFKDAIGYISL